MAGAEVFPQWQDSDFFKLDEADLARVKRQIASKLGLRYGQGDPSVPFAMDYCGIHAFTCNTYNKAKAAFSNAAAKADASDAESAVANVCSMVCTVNGCQILWRPQILVNEGYVLRWLESNIQRWDPFIERKAAAANPDDDTAYLDFACTGSSSLLALIVATVSAFKRTGSIPGLLAHSFSRIRLCIYFNAAAEEIGVLNQAENIEQHERKRHTEMDNILAVSSWMSSLARLSASALNPQCALDVVKFAVALGDPRQPLQTADWMKTELAKAGKPNTLAWRVRVVSQRHITRQFLSHVGAHPSHPQMNTYGSVCARHKFLKGFDGEALRVLRDGLYFRIGCEGLAAKTGPLSRVVLCSDDILTSSAFHTAAEKDAVPAWRDGQAGALLQRDMAGLAIERYFDYGGKNADGSIFKSGQHWAGFGRMQPHIKRFLETTYTSTTWPLQIKIFYNNVMQGLLDGDMATLATSLPSQLSSAEITLRLSEQLLPLRRILATQKTLEMSVAAPAAIPPPLDGNIKGAPQLDIATELERAGQMTVHEKLELVDKLNSDSRNQRTSRIQGNLNQLSAMTLRSCLVVVASAAAAKKYMETTEGGLQARTVFVDATMPHSRQTGPKSRQLCLPPPLAMQRSWAADVKTLPASPIVGHVIARPGSGSCESFSDLLKVTHSHLLKVVVPVAVPQEYQRFVRSGQCRALGPTSDESGGVDFWARTIGRRVPTKNKERVVSDDEGTDGEDEVEEQGHSALDVQSSHAHALLDKSFMTMTDPRTLSLSMLQATLGPYADDLHSIHFQQVARVAPLARYLPKSEQLLLKLSERGEPRRYRKGQVDPSAIASVMQVVLNSSNVPLGHNEVLVVLTSGTPEAIVAGIVCGYTKIIYVAGSQEEANMMSVPSLEEEAKIDYSAP